MESSQKNFLRFEVSFEPDNSDLFFLWFNNYIIEYRPPLKFKLADNGSYNIYLLGGEFGGEDRIIANIQFLKSEDKKYTVKAFQIATPGHIRKQEHIIIKKGAFYVADLSDLFSASKSEKIITMSVPYFVKDFILDLKELWNANVSEKILNELSDKKFKETEQAEESKKTTLIDETSLDSQDSTKSNRLLTSKEAFQLQQILEYKARNPNVTHKELAQLLNVSEKTIQRRLQALEQQKSTTEG